jgi:hypothetical protein
MGSSYRNFAVLHECAEDVWQCATQSRLQLWQIFRLHQFLPTWHKFRAECPGECRSDAVTCDTAEERTRHDTLFEFRCRRIDAVSILCEFLAHNGTCSSGGTSGESSAKASSETIILDIEYGGEQHASNERGRNEPIFLVGTIILEMDGGSICKCRLV